MPDDPERLLLQRGVLVEHPDVHDDLARLVARLGLEAHPHPAVALVAAAVAAGHHRVGEGEEAGAVAAAVAEALDVEVELVLEHRLQAPERHVAVGLAVDRVADLHVVGRHRLGDRAGRAPARNSQRATSWPAPISAMVPYQRGSRLMRSAFCRVSVRCRPSVDASTVDLPRRAAAWQVGGSATRPASMVLSRREAGDPEVRDGRTGTLGRLEARDQALAGQPPRLDRMTGVGAVAAGNAHTAAAAAQVLRAGGNAVDAAVAAGFAASVAEPGLASLGGGGFLLSAPPDGPERLLDFFVDAPGRGRPDDLVPTPLLPITLRFAGADQVFSAGWGSVAVPAASTAGCTPAARSAASPSRRSSPRQRGWPVRAPSSTTRRPGCWRCCVTSCCSPRRAGRCSPPAARCCAPGSGCATRCSPTSWTTSPVAPSPASPRSAGPCSRGDRAGALVSAEDAAAYAVVEREPLRTTYRDAEVMTNALPSFGGTLVLAALEELRRAGRASTAPPRRSRASRTRSRACRSGTSPRRRPSAGQPRQRRRPRRRARRR